MDRVMRTVGYNIKTYKGDEFIDRGDDSIHQFRAKVRAHKQRMFDGGIRNAEFQLVTA